MKAWLKWFFTEFIPYDEDAPWGVTILLIMPIYAAAWIITGIRYFFH